MLLIKDLFGDSLNKLGVITVLHLCEKAVLGLMWAPEAVQQGLLFFQAGGRMRQQNLALVLLIVCCSIFVFRINVCFCRIRSTVVSLVLAKKLAWKNVSEMS